MIFPLGEPETIIGPCQIDTLRHALRAHEIDMEKKEEDDGWLAVIDHMQGSLPPGALYRIRRSRGAHASPTEPPAIRDMYRLEIRSSSEIWALLGVRIGEVVQYLSCAERKQ